jgi:hypothetical protein
MTASNEPASADRRDRVAQLLLARGASEIDHVNGTLFEHLERTEQLLRGWGCSEVVAVAGLAHAAYGTDGFPTALMGLDERELISELGGPDVEALVYLYASCDRGFVYPCLRPGAKPEFRDRFNGRTFPPARGDLRDFVDITLANESDVGLAGSRVDGPPGWLLAMFETFGHLASEPVRRGFRHLTSSDTP